MNDKLKTFLFICSLILSVVALIIGLNTFLQYQENIILILCTLIFDVLVVSLNVTLLYNHMSMQKSLIKRRRKA